MHITDNQDALLDYLYEEGDPAERLKIARHLQECPACSVAVVEFQSVRGLLAEWTPPRAELGFRVVQDQQRNESQPRAREPRAWPRLVGWAQAAAAVLLFAAGMAVSQLTFDYQEQALTVRMRGSRASQPRASVSTAIAPSAPVSGPVSVSAPLTAQPQVLVPQSASASDVELDELLERVRAMIDQRVVQSEQRQQRELALRLSQVAREVDTQHQADLLRIQQNFGQQQDEMMNYLVRTSGGSR